MIRPEVLDALLAAGATAEMIVAAVKADLRQEDVKLQEKREKDAARQRKSRMSRNVTVTPRDKCDVLPPNEYISNPPSQTSSPDGDDPLSLDLADRVVEAWNGQITGTPLPTARKLNPDRRKHLRCRVAEHGEDAVFVAVSNMIQSDFHSGRSGKWTEGNLGWLLKSPENFLKMLERKPVDVPQSSGKQWTAEERAAHLAKLERFGLDRPDPPQPPPDRKTTAYGAGIGQLVDRIGIAR